MDHYKQSKGLTNCYFHHKEYKTIEVPEKNKFVCNALLNMPVFKPLKPSG